MRDVCVKVEGHELHSPAILMVVPGEPLDFPIVRGPLLTGRPIGFQLSKSSCQFLVARDEIGRAHV